MNDSASKDTVPGAEPRHAGPSAQLIHTVEDIVEHAVEAAEQSLAARLGAGGMRALAWLLRLLGWAALAGYVMFCLTMIGLRYWWMPHIDNWREQIEQRASQTLKQKVTIGRIESSWQGFSPRLQLTDVQLHDEAGAVTLTLPQIDAVLSWTSVPTLQARVKSLVVVAPEIEVRRLSDSRFKLAGIQIDLDAPQSSSAGFEWLLEQHHVAVSQATVHYYDKTTAEPAAGPLDLSEVDVLLTRGLGAHYFALRGRPPSAIADVVDIRGWFDHPWTQPVTQLRAWSGRLYARLDFVDMARLETIARQIPEPFHLRRGNGAIRAWVDFNALAVQRARADLAFTDVDLKLRSDLQPLRLASLQGRITQQAWNTGTSQGQDITLSQLTLEAPGGLHLPPTDVSYRVSHSSGTGAAGTQHNEVRASAMELEDLAVLASQLPLPPQTQDLITRYFLRGSLIDLHAAWDDQADTIAPIALQTRFAHLAMAAQPARPEFDENGRPRSGTPGFENLTGSIDLSPTGGNLVLASSEAKLLLPGLLEQPEMPVTRLDAKLHWKLAAQIEVGIDSLAMSNDDLEFTLSGTYRSADVTGPYANVSGNLTRARADALIRYVPLSAGVAAREWMRAALRGGQLSAGSFLLRGPLERFPFVARDSGDFQATVHVSDTTLDYAPSTPLRIRPKPWPIMTGVEADLKFNRNELGIVGSRATIHGVRLSSIQGRLFPLESRESRLVITGQGDGELSDLVAYVRESSVGDLIGGFLSSTQSSGPAHLQIKLDLPLGHSIDTEVAGSIGFKGNDIVLRADIAPLTAVTGRLDFTQRGVHAAGLSVGYLGGQARIDVDTGTGGAVGVRVTGAATPEGLHRQIDSALVRRILDNARGLAKYTASLTARANTLELHAQSDLAGLAIDLPEPLGKIAAERMPLRVDLVPAVGSIPLRETVHVSAGDLVSVELERIAAFPPETGMRIERGSIGIGAPSATPEAGLLVNVALEKLDLDRWLPLLDVAGESSGSTGSPARTGAAGTIAGTVAADLLAARIDDLTISGKQLQNVVLGATRSADGGWNINIDANQTSGSLHWLAGARPGQGKLTARLAHLTIPESAREPVAEVLDAPAHELPELDVIADDFVLGSSRLGRLELDAQNVGSGRGREWQLKRLLIDNPDGKLAGSGQWQREPGTRSRRMTLSMTLDVVNAGNLLGRFGMQGAMKNGSGRISGALSWLGSPFAIDYASLSGELRVNTDKGQFLQADPGAGRLLGVMSLQALPRRVSLDFRDIFSKGFAFDSIRASALISKGVLTTHDFKMTGVNASVLIEGEVDLQAETQKLHVLVLPEINAESASVLYAFIANPAIGVGTLLAQWILRHPLSKIFSYEYDLTGSWNEPQVKRSERPKPEPPVAPAG